MPGTDSRSLARAPVSLDSQVRAGLDPVKYAGHSLRAGQLLQGLPSRVPVSVDLGASTDRVFLSLYGTGFRGATQATATVGGVSVPVSGFAAVGVYQGDDVVNMGPLPRSWRGAVRLTLRLPSTAKLRNTVSVSIR